ncbi:MULTISPECIES: sigma 54-interacting transcriptional regulator [unclassified Mesorhizobium]|uniref:sigma-54 interaction domain-containing protein n=1 Tax=unclassified Mesorhizobium TaxID=325217 RepID=UPI000FD7881A|nr:MULTISPECIES: sigma 54-interacting transcriptional regulator [unclassified Mesorhizobium]TGQ16365.1 sigma-54-dependent Fis family transcriptional regulator [Mesorhizobium sp. M2E.F.Ca.ET.219.01.1.1]TGT77538.1 sigma-54-dependent Fis family transcriptional regulator [Mesorhizobium sp. M2E.F.Ca.ET.166.01.1.1]TGW03647.1 sigma-54-dependent Fis family transcriptional regulator [Mesorhizobium sp. M2E.F.Ca.ET.154.01.1.1]
MNILLAWVGRADLDAEKRDWEGPILGALLRRPFHEAWLLTNWDEAEVVPYLAWLGIKAPNVRIHHRPVPLSQPNAFAEIYRHASATIAEAVKAAPRPPKLTFHLSPGTPVMASVWLLLATSRFPAELIESSAGRLNTVEKPFNLPAQVLPDLLRDPDRRLTEATAERPMAASSFGEITYQSERMRRVISLAKKAAPRNVPLLIEGESGTGKELLAQAVHRASPRAAKDMVVVNCGAIPPNLLESRLFGHIKGAFTGAHADQVGCFEAANGGTLFLDEIGELPLPAQVTLLRVLQEGEVTRIGENKVRKVDVRLIAATNRDLFVETREGRFREDLFYRLAVLLIKLPALRERGADLEPLIDSALKRINEEMKEDPLYTPKSLDADARQVLLAQTWRGNVRELQNTLRRALVWSDSEVLDATDIEGALFPETPNEVNGILDQPLGFGCNLDAILDRVSEHYIKRALQAANGNKTRAAALIGFASYQRLDTQRARLGI